MLLALLGAIVFCTLVAIVLDTVYDHLPMKGTQSQYTEPTASDQLVVSRYRHHQLLDALDYSERRIRDLEWQRNCAEAHATALLDSLHVAEHERETARGALDELHAGYAELQIMADYYRDTFARKPGWQRS